MEEVLYTYTIDSLAESSAWGATDANLLAPIFLTHRLSPLFASNTQTLTRAYLKL